MDLLTTANLQIPTAPKNGNAIANSAEEEGFSLAFPNLLFAQLTDTAIDSPTRANSAAPLNITEIDSRIPVLDVDEQPLDPIRTDTPAVNINRPSTEKVLVGGNEVPLQSLITKRAVPSHRQPLPANPTSADEPIKRSAAPVINGLQKQLSIIQSTGESALPQNPVSSAPTEGRLLAFPQTTVAVTNLKNIPGTLGVQLTLVDAETENLPDPSNNGKVFVAPEQTDSLQNLSVSSNAVSARSNPLTSSALSLQNTVVASNDYPIANVPVTTRGGVIDAGPANSLISTELKGINLLDGVLPASGLAERSAVEQSKLIPTLTQEQTFKAPIDPKPTAVHGIGLVQTTMNSVQPGAKANAVLVNNRLVSNKIPIAPTEALTSSTTALADEEIHGLQSESLGFAGSQQLTQPSHLVAKSGQSHYLGVAQFNDPQFSRNLSDQVLLMAGQGIHKAHISLNPNELGPLEIRLSVVDDEVSVQLASINPAVRESIEQAMPRLRELFDEAGLKLGEHDVSSEFADGNSSEFSGSENKPSYGNSVSAESQKDDTMLAADNDATSSIDTYI